MENKDDLSGRIARLPDGQRVRLEARYQTRSWPGWDQWWRRARFTGIWPLKPMILNPAFEQILTPEYQVGVGIEP